MTIRMRLVSSESLLAVHCADRLEDYRHGVDLLVHCEDDYTVRLSDLWMRED